MTPMRRLALVLAAVSLFAACRGAPAPEATPPPPAPSPQGPPPNAVQSEMRLLQTAVITAVTGIGAMDVRPVAPALHRVHQAKEATEHALESGAYVLPNRPGALARFKELDESFHGHLEALVEASVKNDVPATAEALGRALKACTGCHTEFRATAPQR